MPILIAVVLQCDAPICENSQQGYVDPAGEILFKKGAHVWRRSGDRLVCSDVCEQQLKQSQPTGGAAPRDEVTP